jgi:glycerol-1-phosphate dehydrogenase [NAD(P)+]
MQPTQLQDLLSRIGPSGVLSCACGKEHRLSIQEVVVDSNGLARSAELLLESYGRGPLLWVLSDEKTEAAAADRWKSCVRASRIVSRVLPGDPKPIPTIELVEELCSEVKTLVPDLLVAVGSGVLSDLVKKVSLEVGVPNWCVATAPSVDAYSSATSAIRIAGYHQAVPARPSDVIVCDLEVIGRAPRALFLAGLGDLLAKFLAGVDWNLAHIVTGEHTCETIARFALGSARKALDAAREMQSDPTEVTGALTDAILVSGFAMQALGSSRPAASAEHTIAHFWETANAVENAEYDLHGVLVGVASRLVLRGYSKYYRRLLGANPDVERRLAAFDREPAWDGQLDDRMRPFQRRIAEVVRARVFDRSTLARRLEVFQREKERIVRFAEPLLAELSRAVELLESLGFPFSPAKLGIAEWCQTLSVQHVRLLRNRYTTFDLAYELGEETQLVDLVV